jgi:hypothetical protein
VEGRLAAFRKEWLAKDSVAAAGGCAARLISTASRVVDGEGLGEPWVGIGE